MDRYEKVDVEIMDRYEKVDVEIGDTFVYSSPKKYEGGSLYLLEITEHPLNKRNISYKLRTRISSFEEACLAAQSEGKKTPRKLEFFPVAIDSEDRVLKLDRTIRCES